MELDRLLNEIIYKSFHDCKIQKYEFLTPELILYIALQFDEVRGIIKNTGGDVNEVKAKLLEYLNGLDRLVEEVETPEESYEFNKLFNYTTEIAISKNTVKVTIYDVLLAIFKLEDSYAKYALEVAGVKEEVLINYVLSDIDDIEEEVLEPEKSSVKEYLIDLTELAKRGKVDNLIGREDIIEKTFSVLLRRTKNNPIHIGEPGVGKTAIVNGIVNKIVKGDVPNKLKNANVFSMEIGSMLAGTKYRGDFEERIKNTLKELESLENPIVYIDEIHSLVGAGSLSNGSLDAANILKPYLAAGKIKFIGATTFEEYKKNFEKDKGLVRRFQPIDINEPTVLEAIEIINGIKKEYEEHHNVEYTKDAIEKAVELTNKYIHDRFLPDKAIDIIDEAGALMEMRRKDDKRKIVDRKFVEEVISKKVKIPKEEIKDNEAEKLKKLEDSLRERIFGQDKGIEEINKAIKLSRAGLKDENKPVGAFLFVGPTGVGKTEIANVLSKELSMPLVRFDMSEYGEKHSASKLIGTPPGYVGYEEGGLLTDAVLKNKSAVLLLDEIEKAHVDVFNVLLQVMDYGKLTDNKGRKVDFRNVIIIMTSNAGARSIGKKLVGFGDRVIKEESIDEEVKRLFSPEFRNRLDCVVKFNPIDREIGKLIAKKELDKLKKTLELKGFDITYNMDLLGQIVDESNVSENGGRGIIRTIESKIKVNLADRILFDSENKKINLEYKEGKFRIN